MEWQFVVALIIAVPVILFPVAFIWYINAGGLYRALKEGRRARETEQAGTTVVTREHAYQGK